MIRSRISVSRTDCECDRGFGILLCSRRCYRSVRARLNWWWTHSIASRLLFLSVLPHKDLSSCRCPTAFTWASWPAYEPWLGPRTASPAVWPSSACFWWPNNDFSFLHENVGFSWRYFRLDTKIVIHDFFVDSLKYVCVLYIKKNSISFCSEMNKMHTTRQRFVDLTVTSVWALWTSCSRFSPLLAMITSFTLLERLSTRV